MRLGMILFAFSLVGSDIIRIFAPERRGIGDIPPSFFEGIFETKRSSNVLIKIIQDGSLKYENGDGIILPEVDVTRFEPAIHF